MFKVPEWFWLPENEWEQMVNNEEKLRAWYNERKVKISKIKDSETRKFIAKYFERVHGQSAEQKYEDLTKEYEKKSLKWEKAFAINPYIV